MPMKAITLGQYDKLPVDFYQQKDVCTVARALLGKIVVTVINGELTAARIVETEAYNGMVDKASHSWNGRRTERTEVMYAAGSVSYVYLCYGIHHLFNVVTGKEGVPQAVLIRAAEPLSGLEHMLFRTQKKMPDHSITRGPGNFSRAMGICAVHTGTSLLGGELFIVDDRLRIPPSRILATPRIGVDYAGEDARLPYRFILKDNLYISGKRSQNTQ